MSPRQAAAARLAHGTAQLAQRLGERATAWVRAGRRDDLEGWRAALGCLVRAALLAGGLWLLWRAVRALPALMLILVPLGLLAAWRVGHPSKAPGKALSGSPAGTPDTARSGPTAGLTVDQIRALLHEAFGTDDQAHTAILADRLTTTTGRAWDAADVRAAAEAAGARVEKNIRMPGLNPSTGIRRSTLPAPSPTSPLGPVDGVVVAGQPTATGAATATATPPTDTPREGMRVAHIGQAGRIVYDPAESTRHHTLTPGGPTR
ncbi:hypothetical protein [Streptomyces sp. NPDC095602]|uniref:hypothetical protein n=1 Tax=Streptomyces sp. NPDC095602 TaxID=3155819 RepID=UPI003317CE46